MGKLTGTISRGIRAPIVRAGDDIAKIAVDSILAAAACEPFAIYDRDVVAITEAVVARAQNNYATVEQIAADIRSKYGEATLAVTLPILSRNRFAVLLKGIAMGAKKIVLLLSYPSDEVGNHLFDLDALDDKGVDPFIDVVTVEDYRRLFGHPIHRFTGVDYVEYYQQIIREAGCEVELILANDCRAALKYTKNILCCDIHTRVRSKRILQAAGAEVVYCLDEILTAPVDGSGYNADYGLLGSNKASETRVKLFPRDCKPIVERIQAELFERIGKRVEVMVYGDGAFKDPVGKIWELADPVVSPAYTQGLEGKPNEVKLKYLADNEFKHLDGEALQKAITEYIANKGDDLFGDMSTEGTTPRHLTDLLGSLADLTSGSGDKGTPIVLIQHYFDNYAD